MQSLVTPFIYGILLVVTIASAYELKKPKNRRCIQIPKVVTVQQVTEPVDHAEGPHWEDQSQKLYFVDIHAQKIYRLNTGTGELTSAYIANGPVGLAVTVEESPDQLVAGAGTDIVLITWDSENNSTDPTIQILATVDRDRNGTRFNDGKVDSHGRLWAGYYQIIADSNVYMDLFYGKFLIGTMGPEDESGVAPDLGSLYRMTSDLVCERVISPVNISNGCAWNIKDNVFYYIDSPSLKIVAYDFDADNGIISNKRDVFDLPSHNISGIPDGMTIDTNGNLWIALFNGGHVINVDPVQSKLLQAIEIPAHKVTSVTFGGSLLDILYVTTSRYGLTEAERRAQPRAGSVFAVKGLGVQGFSANSFALHGFNSKTSDEQMVDKV